MTGSSDEHLLAIEDVMVAIANSSRLNARDIASSRRLCDAIGGDFRLLDEPAEILFLLFLSTSGDDWTRSQPIRIRGGTEPWVSPSKFLNH